MPETAHRTDRSLPSTTFAAVEAELAAWRAAHPQATFAELEAAVEAGVAHLRRSFLQAAVPREPDAREATRPRCGGCAIPLAARGQRRRTVQIWGEQAVDLERT